MGDISIQSIILCSRLTNTNLKYQEVQTFIDEFSLDLYFEFSKQILLPFNHMSPIKEMKILLILCRSLLKVFLMVFKTLVVCCFTPTKKFSVKLNMNNIVLKIIRIKKEL